MKLTMYQIDAFAQRVFSGNPAAVCPLSRWLPDALMQAIAEENNLAETAFFVPRPAGGFDLRWFTPLAEVDLCGHATLATAFVLFADLGWQGAAIEFHTRSGLLVVERASDDRSALRMSLPASIPVPCATPAALTAGLGRAPVSTLTSLDYIAVYETEEEIRAIVPDPAKLITLGLRGVIVTAPGREVDFVSRFFAPEFGIYEDPVTGSSHCALAPFWGARFGRTRLRARQLSPRGGELLCEWKDDRVDLIGHAVHYMTAEITVPDPVTA